MNYKNVDEEVIEELEEDEQEELSNEELYDENSDTNQTRVTDATAFKKLKDNLSSNPENKISPIKAIRQKCLDCCCYQRLEVNLCPVENCPLWPYRFGKNPYSNKAFSEEQKAAMAERMRKSRENKAK